MTRCGQRVWVGRFVLCDGSHSHPGSRSLDSSDNPTDVSVRMGIMFALFKVFGIGVGLSNIGLHNNYMSSDRFRTGSQVQHGTYHW